MRRSLTLRREALAELAAAELHEVAGGTASLGSCPVAQCVPLFDTLKSCVIPCYTGNC